MNGAVVASEVGNTVRTSLESTGSECDCLFGWIKKEEINGHIRNNFTKNGELQRFSWKLGRRTLPESCLFSFSLQTAREREAGRMGEWG